MPPRRPAQPGRGRMPGALLAPTVPSLLLPATPLPALAARALRLFVRRAHRQYVPRPTVASVLPWPQAAAVRACAPGLAGRAAGRFRVRRFDDGGTAYAAVLLLRPTTARECGRAVASLIADGCPTTAQSAGVRVLLLGSARPISGLRGSLDALSFPTRRAATDRTAAWPSR